jgi:hypothetical protein
MSGRRFRRPPARAQKRQPEHQQSGQGPAPGRQAGTARGRRRWGGLVGGLAFLAPIRATALDELDFLAVEQRRVAVQQAGRLFGQGSGEQQAVRLAGAPPLFPRGLDPVALFQEGLFRLGLVVERAPAAEQGLVGEFRRRDAALFLGLGQAQHAGLDEALQQRPFLVRQGVQRQQQALEPRRLLAARQAHQAQQQAVGQVEFGRVELAQHGVGGAQQGVGGAFLRHVGRGRAVGGAGGRSGRRGLRRRRGRLGFVHPFVGRQQFPPRLRRQGQVVAGDVAVGDLARQAQHRGQGQLGVVGVEDQRRQYLLVVQEGVVGHLHPGPVGVVLALRQVFQQRVEQPAGVGLAQLQLAHLEGVGAGRHGEHPEGLARELAVGAAPGFDGGLGHRQGAADALVVVGEHGHQHVGHLHRADAGGVAHAGAAVDEHVVVVLAQAGLDGLQEGAAPQALVEGIPVEGVQLGGVARPLAAGGQQVDAAALGEAGEVDAQER